MRLIVNADDFGYSLGQNYGIIDAFENGIVRSASLIATASATRHAIGLAKANPSLGVGVHLVIDMGTPMLEPALIPSLTSSQGRFLKHPFELPLALNLVEVEREWRAQIEFILSQGIHPTHIDGHHHFHYHPQLIPVTCRLALDYQLPIRGLPRDYDVGPHAQVFKLLDSVTQADICLTDFYGPKVDETYFINFFDHHPDTRSSTVELMCHPAFMDDRIYSQSSYNVTRVKELLVLKAPKVWEWVRENSVELINYRNLRA